MCGIAGITARDDRPYLEAMLAAQRHRGPDDQGLFLAEGDDVALGMRRLSILDVAGGHQPMSNEAGTIWIVFNGEIFNSPELREELVEQGHHFRTRNSDTEVLVHLYEELGPAMLQRLNGMFAFVIYDSTRRELFGARDRVGIKPLYYTDHGGRFAFASELKCFRALPWLSQELDFDSVYHYLSLQFVPAPATILRDVRKLPAGCCFRYELPTRTLHQERYWSLAIRPDYFATQDEFVERLRSELVKAVSRATLSDVPIAVSLSGGLDSSSLVGIISSLGHSTVRTFSLGFAGRAMEEYDELPLARLVARRWRTEHHEIVIEPTSILADLEDMAWHLDEPYGGGLPSWYVYRAIGQTCKVVLTGTGGDELFGNYQKWRVYEKGVVRQACRVLKEAWRWRSPGVFANWLRFREGSQYPRYLDDAVKDSLFGRHGPRPRVTTQALLQQAWDDCGVDEPRNKVARIDFQFQLPEEFLTVSDRFSMAHGVEARVPFLDHELVEMAFTVPAAIRTKPGDPKYLARQIVQNYLPAELLFSPKKGFILPLREWTRGELRPMIGDLLGRQALEHAGLGGYFWKKVVEPHLRGQIDRTQIVWTLLMFQIWNQVFRAGGARGARTPPSRASMPKRAA